MYRASREGVRFLDQLGLHLRNVVPDYQQNVLGSVHSDALPQAELAKRWIRTFLEVTARFNGRILTADNKSKPNPKGRDLRWTEAEIMQCFELGRWLIELHHESNFRKTGERVPIPPVTLIADEMIERESLII